MERSPHISLVEAVVAGVSARSTPYHQYLQRTHRGAADESLDRQTGVVHELLQAKSLTVDVEHESVLDGNHRTAVHIVTGVPLETRTHRPYQTVTFPGFEVQGRRYGGRDMPDLRGKRVLDIGCADGMMSVAALQNGATSVLSVDQDLRSTTWQLRDAWDFTNRMEIRVMHVEALEAQEVDVVLAFSVVHHIGVESFVRLTHGRECVFETHSEGDAPPDSGHRWEKTGTSTYSCAEPTRVRDLYYGVPK
jgi:2-polyprenyl-3-methyl-5-hydroxy-6-metoxy-1,4-benzoquinol methylase